MEFDCLAPNELPHITRLYSAYLSGSKKISEFYPHPPTLAAIARLSRERKRERRYPSEMRSAVANILEEQNLRLSDRQLPAALARNLASLREGAMAVVTGQQAGLFGGPAYTFYKVLTAIRIVHELHHRGIEAVPIFWVASEDHDIVEVSSCNWLSNHGLERLAAATAPPGELGKSVGRVALGNSIIKLAAQAADLLEGPAAQEIGNAVLAAYQPDQTYGSAFAKLLHGITERFGLILLDPLDARLHQLSLSLLERVIEQQPSLTLELGEKNKQLDRAGYHAQVKVSANSTLLFGTELGKRTVIRQKNGGFLIGEKSLTPNELRKSLEADSSAFSPNALLRPVVQDALLPTVAYVAGPAEVAYFAQAQVIYRHLDVTMPVIVPRASFTLVEPHVERLMERYGITLRNHVFAGRQKLRRRLELKSLPAGLENKFDHGEAEVLKVLTGLRKPIIKLDSTLGGALDTASRKIRFQIQKLRAKAGRARDLREGILSRHEQSLREALFPDGHLQERELSLLPFLARHGADLLDALIKHAGVGAPAHQVVRL